MKRLGYLIITALVTASCSDFLSLQPEYEINENSFYKTATDFETALIGNYAGLQGLHNANIVYLGDLTTDNAEIRWTSPTVAETEFDEMNPTTSNGFLGNIWSICFSTVSRSNDIISRIDATSFIEADKRKVKGEALFLRAYAYFYLVRVFGDVPLVEVAFRSPKEIMEFDMSRKPTAEVYGLIERDLTEAATLLTGVTGMSKSRASVGAAKTLLGKVYLTRQQFDKAASVLKEVIDANTYTLDQNYGRLFTNGNDELPESVFEIKYLSGNVGEGNSFSSIFTPARFDMAMFPNNMQGSGRVLPTAEIAASYEPNDRRRSASIGDSVRLVTGRYEKDLHGLKFVDFTTGVNGDGGINFTSLRYADVILMYAEALNEQNQTEQAHTYINMIRTRAGIPVLEGLAKDQMRLALEEERQVEFFLEGHRWFDLVRTGRLQTVMNAYFASRGLAFRVDDHEWVMPIPLRELDINPNLGQNQGY